MTTFPGLTPDLLRRPLTVADYRTLGETERGYTELQEGHLLLSPTPNPDHSHASGELGIQFTPQLPDHLEVLPAVDLDLELSPADLPGFVCADQTCWWSTGRRGSGFESRVA